MGLNKVGRADEVQGMARQAHQPTMYTQPALFNPLAPQFSYASSSPNHLAPSLLLPTVPPINIP